MEQMTIRQTIARVGESLMDGGYARTSILQFNSTTNQLTKFMDRTGVKTYTTEVGVQFLQAHYGFDPQTTPNHSNAERLRHLRKLSEYQLHGAVVLKRNLGQYEIEVELNVTCEQLGLQY